ncbi:hypothetical protein DTO195F2_891 [Paecilomyces variotii]|nr:hypothetical protein DTO195F2_891 [Paecilomyces variotii]
MAHQVSDLSDDDIVRLCRNPDAQKCGRLLERILGDIIVKYGWSVTGDEAANQVYAYHQSLGTNIRVPKMYRYFQKSGIGYLLMEFIDGIPLVNFAPFDEAFQDLAEALYDFTTKAKADFPGPRDRGIPRGYLFSEDGAGEPLDSMDKLNIWLDRRARLTGPEKRFQFQLDDCVFCHLDLSYRNIIKVDESFCLLDWEFAGFYPRVFEKYCILFLGQKEDYTYAKILADSLDSVYRRYGLNTDDQDLIGLLNRVYQNNLKYDFGSAFQIDWKAVEDFNICLETAMVPTEGQS